MSTHRTITMDVRLSVDYVNEGALGDFRWWRLSRKERKRLIQVVEDAALVEIARTWTPS